MAHDEFAELRIDYGDVALGRRDLPADPLRLFRSWMEEAKGAGVREPNGMALATCGADGQPHCRVVLLKQLDQQGLTVWYSVQGSWQHQLSWLCLAPLSLLHNETCLG